MNKQMGHIGIAAALAAAVVLASTPASAGLRGAARRDYRLGVSITDASIIVC